MGTATLLTPRATLARSDWTITRRFVAELKLHPVWDQYDLGIPGGSHAAAPAADAGIECRELVAISRSGIVLNRFDLYLQAKAGGRSAIDCIEYPICEAEALLWMLADNERGSFNSFTKIVFALEATKDLRERGRLNLSSSARCLPLTNLSKAAPINYRKDVARISRAGQINVGKVQKILELGTVGVKGALFEGKLSIHRAWLWLQTPAKQDELLYQHLAHGQVSRIARQLPLRTREGTALAATLGASRLSAALRKLPAEESDQIRIEEIERPGKLILVSTELLARFGLD